MNHYINRDKIIEAYISEPYISTGEIYDIYASHGWQIVFIMGYADDGYHNKVVCDMDSEDSCINKMMELNLTRL